MKLIKYSVPHIEMKEYAPGQLNPFTEQVYIARAVDSRITVLETTLSSIVAEASGCALGCSEQFLHEALDSVESIARKALGL